MAELTEQMIRSLYSDTFYKRGKRYYETGSVKDVTYIPEKNIWRAKVAGSRTYNTRVILHEDGIADFCDCPAYPTYGQCKHICATLLAIKHQKESEKPRPSDRSFFDNRSSNNPRFKKAESLIDILGNHEVPAYDKSPLHVEYTLGSYTDSSPYGSREVFTIRLRVGEDRLYVVKDIREFLEAATTHTPVEFGKHFTYHPEYHTFTDEDTEVLNRLIGIHNTEAFYTRSSSRMPRQKSKDLTIPHYALDGLLALLKHRSCKYDDGSSTYKQLEVSDKPAPVSFSLEQPDSNEYRLKTHGITDGEFFHQYGWYSEDGILYKLTGSQKEMLPMLENSKGRVDRFGITISEDQISDFITRALPAIRQLGEVSLEGEISDQVTETPLTIKMFVDQSDTSVDINVRYHYGEISINPLDGEKGDGDQEQILIRDHPKEQYFMEMLKSTAVEQWDGAFHITTEDALFYFLHDTLPDLGDLAEIYIPPALRDMILPEPPKAAVAVDAKESNDFLEVDFTMDGIDPEEIPGVLKAVREKRRFVRLPDGTFMPLNDPALGDVADLHGSLEQNAWKSSGGSMTLPMYRGLQVEDSLMDMDAEQRIFSSSFREFASSIKAPETGEIRIPERLDADLRNYQETGFKWLKSLSRYGIGGILADDMGLGKTLQTITYVLSEMEDGTDRPFLIVTPASLTYNWKNEFDTFAPDTEVTVVAGNAAERKAILESDDRPDVYITSYHTLRQDLEHYRMTFHAMILDEAQAIKNHRTKIAQAVRSVSASRRFALSGTPVENSVDELWSVFQAIMPGFLPDLKAFRSTPPETISRLVRPFIMRRVKEDVLTELPDKIETVHYTELRQEQKKLYLAYLEKIQKETADALAGEGLNKGRMKILAGLTRLRQLCCHPSLFIDEYDGASGKMEALFEIIETALGNKQRMLIFSQFPSMLKIIHEQLRANGRDAYFLDGSTPSQERVRLVESFNSGDEDIFLISLKAGGTGLNLTGADTVILYDLWWNPAVEEQAIGRAHRMGQKKSVQVLRLIAQGTIEEKINTLQQQKKEMIDQIIQPGESTGAALSEEDIREILSLK
ncbi:MAG TPA: DEAD/DEAH box helicase [Candidatus Salinicoccus stercoripullorum]|uniref:DEAD/DEAH box helicase n=1 Tax=Candidatus Salinicoccus stercoripullorum TaxID=2838756 RepID=A0A9D1QGZ4_9STAP|nr:DEAD/DEAH box helicase [Candidatus Salinicoccus stercoripullorum]